MQRAQPRASGEARCGLLPVRCYSCNRVLGTERIHKRYEEWIRMMREVERERDMKSLADLMKRGARVAPCPRVTRSSRRVSALADAPSGAPVSSSFMKFMGLRDRFCCARTLIATPF